MLCKSIGAGLNPLICSQEETVKIINRYFTAECHTCAQFSPESFEKYARFSFYYISYKLDRLLLHTHICIIVLVLFLPSIHPLMDHLWEYEDITQLGCFTGDSEVFLCLSLCRCWNRASPSLVLSMFQPMANMLLSDSLTGQRYVSLSSTQNTNTHTHQRVFILPGTGKTSTTYCHISG